MVLHHTLLPLASLLDESFPDPPVYYFRAPLHHAVNYGTHEVSSITGAEPKEALHAASREACKVMQQLDGSSSRVCAHMPPAWCLRYSTAAPQKKPNLAASSLRP